MPNQEDNEVTDVGQYVTSAPTETINCRLFGHSWRPDHRGYLVEGSDKRPDAYVKKLTCHGGCGCRALDRYNPRTLERIGSRHIDYPDGYLAKGTRLTRLEVRYAEAEALGLFESPTRRRVSAKLKRKVG